MYARGRAGGLGSGERRTARVMLDLFEKALQRDEAGHYPLEEVVHQIVFPMRTTSSEIDFDHQNLWLLDERLTSHSFLAPDKALNSIEVADIDSLKRGDLARIMHERVA